MLDQQAKDDQCDKDDDAKKRQPQAGRSVLREEQAAADEQTGKRDAHREHTQARFKADAVPGPRFAGAAARSVNAYPSICRRPV
jgi:hypothetical protein